MSLALKPTTLEEILVDLKNGARVDPACRALLTELEAVLARGVALERAVAERLPAICFELGTLRNRGLVHHDEQEILRRTCVAVFGLSVGSNVALTWMTLARADVIKVADFDTVSPANLNRLRVGWSAVGRLKADVVREQIQEIHPTARVEALASKASTSALDEWLSGTPRVDVIVDEVDDFATKLFLRRWARAHRVPLVQGSDVGESIYVDVERYDLDPQPELFLGKLPGIETVDFAKLAPKDWVRLLTQYLEVDRVCEERMQEAVLAFSRGELAGVPQLGSVAAMAGGAVASAIKKIRLGGDVHSGRYTIGLDRLFCADYDGPSRAHVREQNGRALRAATGLLE
ncbi:MAG: ThiF family adenylyltransferase [Sandaracinus sp.]